MVKSYHKGRERAMRPFFRKTGFFGKMTARPFAPRAGECYEHRNGQTYQCISTAEQDCCAVLENVRSGWRFTAHNIVLYPDGYIEWGFSTSGRFVK